jgi:hypothetical protein
VALPGCDNIYIYIYIWEKYAGGVGGRLYIQTGYCREVLQTLDAVEVERKENFATNGCGTNACGGRPAARRVI